MLDHHDHHFMCISTMIVISYPCTISLWSCGHHSLPHTHSSHVLLMPNSNYLTHGISNLVSLITKTKLGLSNICFYRNISLPRSCAATTTLIVATIFWWGTMALAAPQQQLGAQGGRRCRVRNSWATCAASWSGCNGGWSAAQRRRGHNTGWGSHTTRDRVRVRGGVDGSIERTT
jgi:hypothetical protein